MKTFEKWKIDELHQTFGLTKQKQTSALLQAWLQADTKSINTQEQQTLERLSIELLENADYWNEDELKFMFIGQLIAVADLKSDKFKIFTQRAMSAEVQGIKLSGVVDFVLATGIAEPQQPFFFLHEYKQERKGSNDPLAQLLSEMLVAQTLNQTPKNIYGCYVLGRFWFFVVLEEKGAYSVSNAYNASEKDDILKIVAIIRQAKQYFEN